MKKNQNNIEKIYKIIIVCTNAYLEILTNHLTLKGLNPVIWDEPDNPKTFLYFYCNSMTEAQRFKKNLEEYIKSIENYSAEFIYSLPIEVEQKEDWSQSWKKYFFPEKVSNRIIIKPSWHEYKTNSENDIIIEIDPGMSFGTGQHGTTKACLQFLDEIMLSEKIDSLLDIGSGSGILSIASAKLGISKIDAFDYDKDAVMIAKENLEFNNLSDSANIFYADLSEFDSNYCYDLVIANILSSILSVNIENIVKTVKKHLFLSGILEKEYKELAKKFMRCGFYQYKTIVIDEWQSGWFTRINK
ncbi:MAG: 50S ribosomal protein L11 methyltransferase [Verrucomicrobiota bacterium]|nr:50S ribosomal protein L11 methyltransferase [Verrucomicrobiota bacterium]